MANSTTPVMSPAAVPHAAITAMPTAVVASATVPDRAPPSESGMRAPITRISSTSTPNTTNTIATSSIPTSSAYNGTNALNAAVAISPANSTLPGPSALRFNSGPGGPSAFARSTSRVNVPMTAAVKPSPAATYHRVSYPHRCCTDSPSAGPNANPEYTATDQYEIASPRRSTGARSVIIVAAPTKNAASPTPVRTRAPTSVGMELATP